MSDERVPSESVGPRRPASPVPAPWLAFLLAIGLVIAVLLLFSRDPEPLPAAAEAIAQLAVEHPQEIGLLVRAETPPAGWTRGRVEHQTEDGRLTLVTVTYEMIADDPDGAGGARVHVVVCSATDVNRCAAAGDEVELDIDTARPTTVLVLQDPEFTDEVTAAWRDVELVGP